MDYAPTGLYRFPGTVQVIKVVDPDTLDVRSDHLGVYERRIRVMCVNSVERGHPFFAASCLACKQPFLFGECVLWVRSLVRPPLDRYGRLVAHVECSRLDYGHWLISEGLARYDQRWGVHPHHVLYSESESAARIARRGLWQYA